MERIPSYVLCPYMVIALAIITIAMVTVITIIVFKGHRMHPPKVSFMGKVMYILKNKYVYALMTLLLTLSAISMPICLWLISDNYDQWFILGENRTVWHNSYFGLWHFLPYLLVHLATILFIYLDKPLKQSKSEESCENSISALFAEIDLSKNENKNEEQ